MRRGRAAGRRGLRSPPARTVAPSSQGLAPPLPTPTPEGLREAALRSPASLVLRHLVPQPPPSGSRAQVRALLRSPLVSAAVPAAPDRLLGSDVPPDCCCIPSGRPAATAAAASVAPVAAAVGSAAVASPHQRAPERSFPGAAEARALGLGCSPPAQSRWQLCSRSAWGGDRERGPRAAQVRDSPAATGVRGPRAARRAARPLSERVFGKLRFPSSSSASSSACAFSPPPEPLLREEAASGACCFVL